MFIDKKEAARRIKNSTGVLSRIRPLPSDSTEEGSNDPRPAVSEPLPDQSKEEFTADALENLLNVKKHRGQHGKLMTTAERANVGLAGLLLGGRRAGLLLGRGPDTSHELRHGYVSQVKMYGDVKEQDAELVQKLNEQKETVRDLAFDRITSAIGLITHEKLEKLTDVTKLARVSRDLVTVVDKTLPKENVTNNGVHFHIWKPEMKEEDHYAVVNVNSPR